MKNKTQILILILVLFGLLLAACGGGDTTADTSAQILTQVAADAATQAAEHPLNTATHTSPTLVPTATLEFVQPTLEPTFTPQPLFTSVVVTQTPPGAFPTQPISGNTTDPNCFAASFESESPPYDYTDVNQTAPFLKTFRVKNIGTCTWTTGLAMVWVHSTLDGVVGVHTFGEETVFVMLDETVAPNEYAHFELPLRAPNELGLYQVYWMLQAPTGQTFGVDGGGSLWIIINVIADTD